MLVANMKYRSSAETSFKILSLLLLVGECAQYDMPKQIRKDYRTVLRHLRGLEKAQLICLARTEPAKKGGKDKKIYTLTLLGFAVALSSYNIEPSNREIDEIIQKWRHLHPIFGRWQVLITKVPRIEAYATLAQTVDHFDALWRLQSSLISKNLEEQFSEVFLAPIFNPLSAPLCSLEKWITFIQEDEKLKTACRRKLEEQIKKTREELKIQEDTLKKLT